MAGNLVIMVTGFVALLNGGNQAELFFPDAGKLGMNDPHSMTLSVDEQAVVDADLVKFKDFIQGRRLVVPVSGRIEIQPNGRAQLNSGVAGLGAGAPPRACPKGDERSLYWMASMEEIGGTGMGAFDPAKRKFEKASVALTMGSLSTVALVRSGDVLKFEFPRTHVERALAEEISWTCPNTTTATILWNGESLHLDTAHLEDIVIDLANLSAPSKIDHFHAYYQLLKKQPSNMASPKETGTCGSQRGDRKRSYMLVPRPNICIPVMMTH